MMSENGTMASWEGYQKTVDFYDKINFFNFTNLSQWSIFMGILMTPIIMLMVSKTKEMELRECFFALMATGLLNIYVFSITKELIQILFFALIYIIICLPIKNVLIKILGCAAVFYWESTFYRSYYIIMAAMTVFLYFVFLWLKRKNKINKKTVFVTIILCFAAVFLFLYASQFISQEDFLSAINTRDTSVNENANTAIMNVLEVNGNFAIFMLDYVVAAIRMMIPIELLIKSPMYAPFVLCQFFILYYFIKSLINVKKLDSNMIVVISCFSAYLFGSFIFEPDFGSWVRHEAATFPILQIMAFNSHVYGNEHRSNIVEEIKVYETKNS